MVITSNEDVGSTLSKACEHGTDNDAVHLSRAANIARREMLRI